jgi:hypothetical protein
LINGRQILCANDGIKISEEIKVKSEERRKKKVKR